MERLENKAYVHDAEVEIYREKIVEMVGEISNELYLKMIYGYVRSACREEKNRG